MKLYSEKQERQEYVSVQIARSNRKLSFCKVYFKDVDKYYQLILRDVKVRGAELTGPILCLGTRSGREIDLFRVEFYNQGLSKNFISLLELAIKKNKFPLSLIESIGRSDVNNITEDSAIGVEINPSASRKDTWIGSFDEMPQGWGQKFNILYSNSFDHSYDVNKTAKEWLRVIKPGGYLILCTIKESTPSPTDRVANITLSDILGLFPGELVLFQNNGNFCGYSETIIKINS